ncbi:MAG: LysM peptidoglycan-binding domain-containing protein [Anaerolineaceae bacterium]|nr:LysM peptidoglycan-binding domain-containing protein [Anaerolineaceae bacterium]
MKNIPRSFLIFGTLIVLMLLPILACTRSANSPQQLTAIAERAAVSRITAAVIATEEQKFITPSATFTVTPTETLAPEAETATAAVLNTATLTPAPTDTPTVTPTVPTPRSTIAVETIAPSTATATAEISVPTSTPTPDIPLPVLVDDFRNKAFYVVQTGDTAPAIALRYGTSLKNITSSSAIDPERFLKPGTLLLVNAPKRNFSSGTRILPDEYIVMGYPSIGYDLTFEVNQAGGYLSTYEEYTASGTLTGTEIIQKVALDYSISPIILMELLEYKSHWVSGYPHSMVEEHYPLGWLGENSEGLYRQLTWAAQTLSQGYYGWRYGKLSEIPFYKYPQPDEPVYFNPLLNAGSVAIQYLFAQLCLYDEFEEAIYGANGFLQQFYLDFGNVWDYYVSDPNGFNDKLTQPVLTLPYTENDLWSITGGPHESWTTGSPQGALDFAPPMAAGGCARSDSWITASAPGLVLRNGVGTVVLDLDMDGHEETGWVIYYLHVRTDGKAEPGTTLPLHGRVGHPSCEGGNATGTHLHIARKYNGEWVQAYGPIPFDMSGWIPFGGESYAGGVARGDEIVYAEQYASMEKVVHY